MTVWLIQTVISPYRIKLFRGIAETPGVDFTLILLSDRFRVRPQWKREVGTLPFRVEVPFGLSMQSGPEKEFCINPFLLCKLLARRPDVVICGGYSFATLMVWIASWLTRTKYVIWTEATLHTDGRVKGLRLWLRRLMARRASAFVDAGTLARDYVAHLRPALPPERRFRAFNSVDNEHFTTGGKGSRDFFTKKGFPEKNLVFVGKLNERKGLPQLLEVYRQVATGTHHPVGLILVGEGDLRDEAERFKKEHRLPHLRLEGWVPNEETAKYYGLSDAFVLLSRVDHNPLVLFEALAAGVPIICSHGACNAVDFVENGQNGYIVDPGNVDEVVARTREVLNWDARRRELCEQFSWETVKKANYADAATAFLEACRQSVSGRFGNAAGNGKA